MEAHDLLSLIAIKAGLRRCLMLTSGTAGNPALRGVPVLQFEMMLSVQFGVAQATDPTNRSYRPLDQVADELNRLPHFEIAFVDPYHSYRDSVNALELAESRVEDAGWMVVHDCFPPDDLTGEDYQDGHWCGQTFSAFRDVAARSGRAWFVLDADYGLGVLGPRNSAQMIVDTIDADIAAIWLGADRRMRRDLLKTHGRELLRVLPPGLAEIVLARIIDRQPVRLADLAPHSASPPFDPREPRKGLSFFRRTARRIRAACH